jgi:protein-disulfide isomerase
MTTGQSRVARLVLPVGDRDHIEGPSDAQATLVEYGDYECPFCGQAYPIIKAVQRHLGRRLRFVFRNFPLTEMHPHALKAAMAAEAAGAQGQFWPMHDLLYEHQDALDERSLARYAESLHLDVERFRSELRAETHAPRVHEDFMSGVRSGVNGTPTMFVNGIRHDGPWDAESLTAALTATAHTGTG